MLTTIANITVILVLLLFLYIGYSTGIIKSFFAATAGFVSVCLAESYPYQEGINYYFVFIATAVIIFIIGIIVFKIAKFLYLSLFDKIVGACLGIFIGFGVSANFIIPTVDKIAEIVSDFRVQTDKVSKISSKVMPMFGNYVPNVLARADLSDLKDEFKIGLENIKTFGRINSNLENQIQNITKEKGDKKQ